MASSIHPATVSLLNSVTDRNAGNPFSYHGRTSDAISHCSTLGYKGLSTATAAQRKLPDCSVASRQTGIHSCSHQISDVISIMAQTTGSSSRDKACSSPVCFVLDPCHSPRLTKLYFFKLIALSQGLYRQSGQYDVVQYLNSQSVLQHTPRTLHLWCTSAVLR